MTFSKGMINRQTVAEIWNRWGDEMNLGLGNSLGAGQLSHEHEEFVLGAGWRVRVPLVVNVLLGRLGGATCRKLNGGIEGLRCGNG